MRSALTRAVRSSAVSALRAGLSYEAAAACAGVSRASLFRWLERGERELERRERASDGESVEPELRSALTEQCVLFALEVRRAEAELERETLAPIAERAVRWQASAWRLERRFPRRYGGAIARDGTSAARSGVVVLPPFDAPDSASPDRSTAALDARP